MTYTCGILLLCLGYLVLPAAAQQPQDYQAASSAMLQTYLQEQRTWNHYFTTIAPDQSARAQLTPQDKYRRFLHDTLGRWHQLSAPAPCLNSHLLYELALVSYGVAADFRLAYLYARNALLGPQKATDLTAERARHYTSTGDTYFRQATELAQATGCTSAPASD